MEYYLPEKWEESHQKLMLESRARLIEEREAREVEEKKKEEAKEEEAPDKEEQEKEVKRTLKEGWKERKRKGTAELNNTDDTNNSESTPNPATTGSFNFTEIEPEDPTKDYKWIVTRIDDHDNKFIVKKFEAKEDAQKFEEYLMSLGHHQCYYTEPIDTDIYRKFHDE